MSYSIFFVLKAHPLNVASTNNRQPFRKITFGKSIAPMLILLLLVPLAGRSQETRSQSIYWIRYQNQLLFSEKLYWNNELDNRRFFAPDVQHQLIFHSRLHYKIKKFDYGAGLTVSWAYAQFPEEPVAHPTMEIRPVVEVTHENKIRNWIIQNRVRLDNRFFEADKNENILEHSRYTARLRYRFQLRIPLLQKDGSMLAGMRIADEVMLNHRQNTFDQNRVYVSLDLHLSKKISLETGYIYIYQQRFGTEDFFNRHVLRFSVLHKIPARKA